MRSTMLNGRRAEPDPFGGVFKQFARCPKKRMGLKGTILFREFDFLTKDYATLYEQPLAFSLWLG